MYFCWCHFQDELDTPVPTTSKTGGDGGRSQFGFGVSTTYSLAEIHENEVDEHPGHTLTPNTSGILTEGLYIENDSVSIGVGSE